MPSIVLFVHSDTVDLVASRIREHRLDCTIRPPCGIELQCEEATSNVSSYFPGLTETTSDKLVIALLGPMGDSLVRLDAVSYSPFRTQTDGNLHLHVGEPSQILYLKVAGPDTYSWDMTKGGCWVLFRAEQVAGEYILQDMNEFTDDQLYTVAMAMRNALD